jgi:hypothetical protein
VTRMREESGSTCIAFSQCEYANRGLGLLEFAPR